MKVQSHYKWFPQNHTGESVLYFKAIDKDRLNSLYNTLLIIAIISKFWPQELPSCQRSNFQKLILNS